MEKIFKIIAVSILLGGCKTDYTAELADALREFDRENKTHEQLVLESAGISKKIASLHSAPSASKITSMLKARERTVRSLEREIQYQKKEREPLEGQLASIKAEIATISELDSKLKETR